MTGHAELQKHCLAPVVDAHTRVLVLGSLPGEVSLQRAQYYGHPRNLFWRLIGAAIGRDLVDCGYDGRLAALRAARVGLWDVIGSARRTGSLDAAIRDHRANDLADLVEQLPHLAAVGFNGATASRIGRSQLERSRVRLIHLPSSSPAYASMPFADKSERWRELARYL